MGVVTGNSFSLFCSKWRAFLNMFVRLFRIKLSESREKSLPGAIYSACVIATRDSLFCEMFSPSFCFGQEKTLKNFSKKTFR